MIFPSFLDSVKKRADGSGKGVKTAAEFCGIELIRQPLYLYHIADIGEGIVVALVSDAILSNTCFINSLPVM